MPALPETGLEIFALLLQLVGLENVGSVLVAAGGGIEIYNSEIDNTVGCGTGLYKPQSSRSPRSSLAVEVGLASSFETT